MKYRINHDKVAEVLAKLNALISAIIFVQSSSGNTDPVPDEIRILSDDAGALLNHLLAPGS